MFNRVIYRFMVSRVDEKDIHPQQAFEQFIKLYEDVYFAGIPIRMSLNYSSMNKKTIYVHASCKFPYEVCMDDEDYNEENAILIGIDITDTINDKCLDLTYGKHLSQDGIVAVLDIVLVNDMNCSDRIDEFM